MFSQLIASRLDYLRRRQGRPLRTWVIEDNLECVTAVGPFPSRKAAKSYVRDLADPTGVEVVQHWEAPVLLSPPKPPPAKYLAA